MFLFAILAEPQPVVHLIIYRGRMQMINEKSATGLNIEAITFDEHGEMMVLDNQFLELISGGGKKPTPTPNPTPSPTPPIGSGNNGLCGINFWCPDPGETPKVPG